MIPYLPSPGFALGPVAVSGQGVCVALGFGLGAWLWGRSLRKRGLADELQALWLALAAMVAALIGGRLLGALLGATQPLNPGQWLDCQASLGALLGVALLSRWLAWRLGVAWTDLVVSASAPLLAAWLLVRLGCVLAHDHVGAASTHALAVAFPNGGRWDLGLLEWLALLPLAAAFVLILRAPWGDERRAAGALALGYALVRFALLPMTAASQTSVATGTDLQAVAGATVEVGVLAALAWLGVWLLVRGPAAAETR